MLSTTVHGARVRTRVPWCSKQQPFAVHCTIGTTRGMAIVWQYHGSLRWGSGMTTQHKAAKLAKSHQPHNHTVLQYHLVLPYHFGMAILWYSSTRVRIRVRTRNGTCTQHYHASMVLPYLKNVRTRVVRVYVHVYLYLYICTRLLASSYHGTYRYVLGVPWC